jgi:hypothetical protein
VSVFDELINNLIAEAVRSTYNPSIVADELEYCLTRLWMTMRREYSDHEFMCWSPRDASVTMISGSRGDRWATVLR